MSETTKVPISKLKPLFIREVSPEGLEELVQSVKFAGVMQNLVVRASDYGIIAGYRRYQAAKLAGLTEVPAVLVDCDDAEAFRLSLIENLQRENLSDYETAKRLREFKDKTGFTDEQIGQLIGKSQTWVSRHLSMLELEKLSIMPRGMMDKITEHHARAILSQPNKEIREALIDEVERTIAERGEPPSIREIERKAKEFLKLPEPEVEEGSVEEVVEAAERVASELSAGEMVELKTPEDVDRFFDEIFASAREKDEVLECPCGCRWSLEINWKKKTMSWISP